MISYIVLTLGVRPSKMSQRNFDATECRFYSKKDSELTGLQRHMRQAKLIFNSPSDVEDYRVDACTRAGLNPSAP